MDLLKSRRRFLQGLAAVSVYGSLSPFGLSRMALAGQTEQAKLKVVFVVVPDGLAVEFIQALPAKCVAQALAIDPRAEVQA